MCKNLQCISVLTYSSASSSGCVKLKSSWWGKPGGSQLARCNFVAPSDCQRVMQQTKPQQKSLRKYSKASLQNGMKWFDMASYCFICIQITLHSTKCKPQSANVCSEQAALLQTLAKGSTHHIPTLDIYWTYTIWDNTLHIFKLFLSSFPKQCVTLRGSYGKGKAS